MKLSHILLMVFCCTFMPSCDKEDPVELDCIGKAYESEIDLDELEVEPLENEVWREDERQKEKVAEVLAERGVPERRKASRKC